MPDYPWHETAWRSFERAMSGDRIPQAILVSGQRGLGKSALAERIALAALCDVPTSDGACASCRSCRLTAAGTHPDLVRVRPEEGERSLSIDRIRQLGRELSLSSHLGGHKVAIIDPADSMTLNAANSLLKTLEEPASRTLLILVASRPWSLPATVRSRCQLLRISTPGQDVAQVWLNGKVEADPALLLDLAGGAPLTAISYDADGYLKQHGELSAGMIGVLTGRADPVSVAGRFEKLGLGPVSDWLGRCVMNLIRHKVDGVVASQAFAEIASAGSDSIKNIELEDLFQVIDQIQNVIRDPNTPLNARLVIESLLLRLAPVAA